MSYGNTAALRLTDSGVRLLLQAVERQAILDYLDDCAGKRSSFWLESDTILPYFHGEWFSQTSDYTPDEMIRILDQAAEKGLTSRNIKWRRGTLTKQEYLDIEKRHKRGIPYARIADEYKIAAGTLCNRMRIARKKYGKDIVGEEKASLNPWASPGVQ